MTIATWIFGFIGVLLVAATLPVVLELALLTSASFLPRRKFGPCGDRSSFRLSVVIPAHNEELLIARCVKSLRASAVGTVARIVVIAHNCSDQTAECARQAGAEAVVYDDPRARGKGFALLHGFEHVLASATDGILVIDADSTVSQNLIQLASNALAGGAEAVQCRYELDSSPDRPKTRLAALAFRGFNLIRAGGRDRLGLSAGILGTGLRFVERYLRRPRITPFRLLRTLNITYSFYSPGRRSHSWKKPSSLPAQQPRPAAISLSGPGGRGVGPWSRVDG